MGQISIGVVGSGVFGRYHALKCVNHPEVKFIGFVTSDIKQAKRLCQEVGGQVFKDTQSLAKQCDGIIIACPAIHHFGHARTVLENDCHVLVEKPLVTRRVDGEALLELANRKKRIIQVGHQERFVARAIGLDQIPDTPIAIKAKRMGPYSVRGTDASVTLDLMTHDLDLVLWMLGEHPKSVSGFTQAVRSEQPDASIGFLQFSNTKVRLEASRVEEAGERIMKIDYPKGRVIIDFNAKTIRNNTPYNLNEAFADHPEVKDSLAAGLDAFVEAIRSGEQPWINGEAGLAAVQAALQIDGDIS